MLDSTHIRLASVRTAVCSIPSFLAEATKALNCDTSFDFFVSFSSHFLLTRYIFVPISFYEQRSFIFSLFNVAKLIIRSLMTWHKIRGVAAPVESCSVIGESINADFFMSGEEDSCLEWLWRLYFETTVGKCIQSLLHRIKTVFTVFIICICLRALQRI